MRELYLCLALDVTGEGQKAARKLARMEGEADHGWDGVAAVLGVE